MIKKFILFLGLIATSIAFAQINTGNPTVPFGSNTSYDYGMLPTNLPTSGTYGTSTVAGDAYNDFKSNFIENCGSDRARVKFDTQSETVSEGIAYTMLLAAYAADQDVFNRLWAYYKFHRNGNGVMHWKINGCNSVVGQNGATDAELDAAMALIVADFQWGSTGQAHDYTADAIALIQAIRSHEVNFPDKTFNNGDGWGDAGGCRNPSYQTPAYARVYQKFLEENGVSSHAAWPSIATASRDLLVNNSNNTSSGLASNWCLVTGIPNNSCSASGTTPFSFGYDACRAPWRQGTDYLWFGTTSGLQSVIDTQTDFWIGRGGATQVRGGNSFGQDGNGNGDHNGAFLGMVGAQSLAASNTAAHRNFINQMYNENRNVDANNYFSKVLRCLGLFVQTGNFWNPYSAANTNGNTLPSVSITSPSNGFQTCLGVDFDVEVSASDLDGTVTKVEFFDGADKLGEDATAPYVYSFIGATAGSYEITAKAHDNDGAISTSSVVNITIAASQSSNGSDCEAVVVTGDYHAAIDDFDSVDEVSDGTLGGYGIFWWTDENDATNTYSITRNATNMTVALTNASPTYKVFGLSFGEDKFINLNDFSNANIQLDMTNNTNHDIYFEIQLKDVNGNKAEIFIEDENTITWNNKWKKIGVDIAQGARYNNTIDLSSIPNQLGGFHAVSFNCGPPTGAAVTCPEVEYRLDPSKVTEIVFIVNGGAGVDNMDYSAATGNIVFNYFSIGETVDANSNIIQDGISAPDADSDGVADVDDLCANTPPGIDVDATGCPLTDPDEDNDGVPDDSDVCANTPSGVNVNTEGCQDDDEDGVANTSDNCLNTPSGEVVNAQGCSDSDLDSDNDGVLNTSDNCQNTPSGVNVNTEGCQDDDEDGVANTSDNCLNTSSGEVVNAQGCSDLDLDSDNDGVLNTSDICQNTPSGVNVNTEGCQDDDDDGVANTTDNCLGTPSGQVVDAAGCGVNGLDHISNYGINIFPNPAKESMSISQPELIMTSISIVDLTGLEVLSQNISASNQLINLSELENGVYIMILNGNNGSTQQRIVVE